MSNESSQWGAKKQVPPTIQTSQQEHILAAIVLLIGPSTDEQRRQEAALWLEQGGSEALHLLLHTLHLCPEIAPEGWPWWPPQYAQIARLLLALSRQAGLSLTQLLHYSPLVPPGPVLWTSVIEASGLLASQEEEPLLLDALRAPWWMVRYAAAAAVANRVTRVSLNAEICQELYRCQFADDALPVRLVASSALLRAGDSAGLDALMRLLDPALDQDMRRAALFVLTTELPLQLALEQRRHLEQLLFQALQDSDQQIAYDAARALRTVATPALLPDLDALLERCDSHTRLAVLNALEELASRKTMRHAIRQQQLARHIVGFLRAPEEELRRQACYTLAYIGGEYVTAILGSVMLDALHPARQDVVEALRLLPGVYSHEFTARAVCWLLHALMEPPTETQVRALDSLTYLIWQARIQRLRILLTTITREIEQSGAIAQVLASPSALVRQRMVELLSMLDSQLYDQRTLLLEMLHHDQDSSVRASIAYALGCDQAPWAVADLLQSLLDSDEAVAETALNALGAIPTPDSIMDCFRSIKRLGLRGILRRQLS